MPCIPICRPIYNWGALPAASSWDGGGCASGVAGRVAARAKEVWCRPSCTNDYDFDAHGTKTNWHSGRNPMLLGIYGESAMPCMWDDCEFRLRSMGDPPKMTLLRSGNCSDSWMVYDLKCNDGSHCGQTRNNKCVVGSDFCNDGGYCTHHDGSSCGDGGPGLCSDGSACSTTTETGDKPNLTEHCLIRQTHMLKRTSNESC